MAKPASRERITKSIEFMKGHLREPLTVATLAALVNLSRSHYTTTFRRVTGYAPLSYLNHLRMQRAVQLLNTLIYPSRTLAINLAFPISFTFRGLFEKCTIIHLRSIASVTRHE